jgi:hypothetical protein
LANADQILAGIRYQVSSIKYQVSRQKTKRQQTTDIRQKIFVGLRALVPLWQKPDHKKVSGIKPARIG